jgi:hypothetical protein
MVANENAPRRGPDKKVGTRQPRRVEEIVYVLDDLAYRMISRNMIALTKAKRIVTARAGELRDTRLDQGPVLITTEPPARRQNDGRLPMRFSRAFEKHLVPLGDRNKMAG